MHSKHGMPFGAEILARGVRFALWAPSAERVDLVCGSRRTVMEAAGQGWYKFVDETASAGERYGFVIDGQDDLVPDPASRYQDDDSDRRSTVIDPCAYEWADDAWRGRPWAEVVLNEMHVGAATPDGTVASLAAKLPVLKNSGITAIQLMPLAETTGLRTWGYDGVLPFSPNNAYGQPDDFKRFVDRAHGEGLMVFLDVVYNHFGPSGNFLHSYAKPFFTDRHTTPWGAAINVDGASAASDVVREFFIQNALYWIEEYHIDGLRFDAVHAIIDDSDQHFLDELAERIREAFPDRHVHLVLENEKNEASRLVRDGEGNALHYDAQWDDDYHHCWHVLLTGEDEGYYGDFGGDTIARLGRCLAEGFAYQGEYSPNLKRERGEPTDDLPPQAFVTFLQNHDQIGNRAHGERLTRLADAAKLRLARAVLYLAPQIPMIFMGDEWGSTTPFQFFVNFENDAALEEAIRRGRAKEFENFKSFAGSDPEKAVPDPTSVETFKRSKIDWSEAKRSPFDEILAETRELLSLRQRAIVPVMGEAFIGARSEKVGGGGLRVEWVFETNIIGVSLNLGSGDLIVDIPSEAHVLWSNSEASSALSPLRPWTGVIYKTVRQ